MRKATLFALFFITTVSWSSSIFAEVKHLGGVGGSFKNEPTGFRSHSWNVPPEDFSGLLRTSSGNAVVASYVKENEDMVVWPGQYKLCAQNIEYIFFQGGFAEISLVFPIECEKDLIAFLVETYGEPTKRKRGKMRLSWFRKHPDIKYTA